MPSLEIKAGVLIFNAEMPVCLGYITLQRSVIRRHLLQQMLGIDDGAFWKAGIKDDRKEITVSVHPVIICRETPFYKSSIISSI